MTVTPPYRSTPVIGGGYSARPTVGAFSGLPAVDGPTTGILTEGGDFLITEAGDYLVQEA